MLPEVWQKESPEDVERTAYRLLYSCRYHGCPHPYPWVTCKYQAILYCEIVSCLAVTGMRPGMYNPVKSTLGITVQAAGGDPERRTLVRAGIRTDF